MRTGRSQHVGHGTQPAPSLGEERGRGEGREEWSEGSREKSGGKREVVCGERKGEGWGGGMVGDESRGG